MINNLVSYFNPDGTPTAEGLKFFRNLESATILGNDAGITNIITLSQAEYDALSPPDENTLYIIE